MNRRQMIGWTGLAMGTLLVGCNTQNALSWAKIVVDSLTDALPVFEQYLPAQAGLIRKALVVAKQLQTALQNKDPNAIVFLEQLVAPDGLINQIIDTVGLISDPNVRTTVTGILILAGVSLRLIAASLGQAPAPVVNAAKVKSPKAAATIQKVTDSDKLDKLLLEVRF